MEDKAKDEILEAINIFSTHVDDQFSDIRSKMATKEDLTKQKHEIMDSMDDKLADLKGDLVVLMRREDKKVSELIVTLRDTKVLSAEDAERLLALNPFPQSAS
ncbi:MAG: hypothetical protein ABIH67_01270 [Candidatus Uhrbacteria bacterium]